MRKRTDERWTFAPDVILEPAPPARGRRSGWLYAIREGDMLLTKIGCTRRGVALRFELLACELRIPFLCVGVVYVGQHIFAIERAIHAFLPAEHIEGEWFYMTMSQARLEALVVQASTAQLPVRPAWYRGRYRRSHR